MEFFPSFNTFVSIGSFQIRWYAICILTGALIALFIGKKRFKSKGYNPDILSDFLMNMLVIGIIGARIWYVVFMFDEIYIQDPMQVFAVWNGGLAIQGGILAALPYTYYYFKKHNIRFLAATDALMPLVLIAQACGRWGNFFNHEAYGVEVPLEFLESLHLPQFIIDNMYIGGAYHHPTFLYESLGNIICCLLIIFVISKLIKKEGVQFFSYFVLYGILRFFVEGLRTDSLMLGSLRMAQLTSIAFIIAGVIGIVYVCLKGREVE